MQTSGWTRTRAHGLDAGDQVPGRGLLQHSDPPGWCASQCGGQDTTCSCHGRVLSPPEGGLGGG